MKIEPKPTPDPVASLHTVDAYMLWALIAAEEVVGKNGMTVVLRKAGLEHLINNYPPSELTVSGRFTFGDYANLCTELLTFFGRAGKSMTIRIGRLSAKYSVEQQASVFGLNTLVKASRVLPLNAQQKAGLTVMQGGLKKLAATVNEDLKLRIEDRGHAFAYIDETCAFCAGKQADTHICWAFNGSLSEATTWLTGKEFDIQEVECRAMGASACVWEISKTPHG
jgi:predicted hydrocarbon binding protein